MTFKSQDQQYYPPATPNWTGTSYRTTAQAFGKSWVPEATKTAERSHHWVLLVVAAVVGFTLLAFFAKD